MTMRAEHIIKRPLILTEKGNRLREEENQYLFEVARDANKVQIRNAVEALWKVSVLKVHTLNVRGHMRRMGRGHAKTQNWKKAIVSLKQGDTIDFFEGT
jgi:large subunit ribosomal protein L23